jgi:hypothetical protein
MFEPGFELAIAGAAVRSSRSGRVDARAPAGADRLGGANGACRAVRGGAGSEIVGATGLGRATGPVAGGVGTTRLSGASRAGRCSCGASRGAFCNG